MNGAYTTSGTLTSILRSLSRIIAGALFMFLALPVASYGQAAKAEAHLDKDLILIGQQAHLSIGITYRVDGGTSANIGWPLLSDTLTSHIEVVHDSGIDTVMPYKEGDPYQFKQTRTLTITSFDSGYWAVPPFRFAVNGDTLETEAMLITVNTVEVDTTGAIKDIKEIYEVPWSWKDWLREHWPWVAGGIAAAGILAALLLFLLRRKKPQAVVLAPAIVLPAHERALRALAEVDRKQLWQQGQAKEFHSSVTDILRAYIEERFGVPALESTTDELLGAMRMSSMQSGQREQLANLLRMADMVKFAKWTPLPTENEQLMAGAIKLIQQTAEIPGDAQRP